MSKALIYEKLDEHVFVTKLAGFEHTEYIQGVATHKPVLEDDIPMVQGKNIRNGFFVNSFDWYISKDVSDSLPRSILNKPCLLIPYVGSNLGEIGVFPNEFTCHLASNVAKVELITNNYILEYIKYYLQSDIGQAYLFQSKQGSAQPNITMESIRDTFIIKRDINDQKKICGILAAMDEKIQLNEKVCRELESMAKTIYDYWFSQFDFPDEDGKPYRSSGGEMVWNDQLKKKIPKGWTVQPLSCVISSINTGLNPRDNFVLGNGAIKYITVKNLTTAGTIDFTGCDTIDNDAREVVHRRSDISVGDILFASIAPLGRCYLIQNEPEDWDINESVFSIRSNTEYVTPEFLYMYFMGDTFIKGATSSSTGSIFKGIRINTLLDIMAVVPPKDIVEAFTVQIKKMLELKEQKYVENRELIKIRDWLLPMLMNGQATVE